jgi:hypothetical protein
MSQPNFNQDLELFKLNLVAEEWRGAYRDRINTYMTALIALLAVELTTYIGLDLAGYFWFAISAFVVFLSIEGPYFLILLNRTGKRYKKKLLKVTDLIKKVENREPLGDFDTLMKDDKSEADESKGFLRRAFRFGMACVTLSGIMFGVQFVLVYFQNVINGTTSTYGQSVVKSASSYVDWTIGVFIAVFFGALMIGALILVIPWKLLEETATMRRGRKLGGL